MRFRYCVEKSFERWSRVCELKGCAVLSKDLVQRPLGAARNWAPCIADALSSADACQLTSPTVAFLPAWRKRALWQFLKVRNHHFATSRRLVCFYAYFCHEIKCLRKCFGRAYSSVTPEPITHALYLGP